MIQLDKKSEKNNTVQNNKRKNGVFIFAFVFCIVILIIIFLILLSVIKACGVIQEYNNAVNIFNLKTDEYNKMVSKTCVDNIDGFPDKIDHLKTESIGFNEGLSATFGVNSILKIKEDTSTVNDLTNIVSNNISSLKQITNPESDWVAERLSSVDDIEWTQVVTEDNDINEVMGKEGGYIGCVYFTVKDIDSEKIKGNTVIEKGTDAGGAVEIYNNVEDAKSRCEYLSDFDNTILYSGSYTVVGTNVVRTSYLLTDEEQYLLTDKIIKSLTAIE